MYEEWPGSLGLVSVEKEQTKERPHSSLQLPQEERGGAGTELCSLVTETGPEGMA